ncbi:PIR protein [Plasmodium vivax]|nr:PIR protein [Plasmodium vivax]CAI7723888.1 PIR protein [Plasmodium vivax]
MAHWNQQYRNVLWRYQQFNDNRCITDFVNFKKEIEPKISALNKKDPKVFCKECVIIKDSIIGKDTGFKKCFAGGSKKLNLIEDNSDIQRFIGECTTFHECVRKRSAHNRPVPLKSTNTDQCEKNGRCNNGNSRTMGVGRKEQQGLATETSRTGRSRTQKPQSTGAQQVEEKDSKQQTKVSQIRTIANTLPNPVTTQHGRSESASNNQPITSAQVTTSTPPLTASGHKSTTEVDNSESSPPPQSRSDQESDSDISLQQSHKDKGPIPKNSPDNQSDRNNPGERDIAEHIDVRQDRSQQAAVTEIPDSAVPAGADTGNVVTTHLHNGSTHLDTAVINGNNSDDEADVEAVDHDSTSSRDTGIENSVRQSSAESDTIRGNTNSGGGDHTKISDVNDEPRSSEGSCIEQPCSKDKGSELIDDKSDIFGKIFDAMSNKNHIIQASVPMGIVLLFTLLFKYTPLWRLLTKRKRNKRSHMNEKLQRVLQQPSIASEERSIPFSYSTFEYSS